VQVVALDWKWLFIYPEQGVASVNELVLPVGAPAHFSMTSASVMNTFYIAQLGGMIYVMNGMVTQLSLQADQPGDYYGRSGHFSGDGFSAMQFTAHAVPQAQFTQWVEATRNGGGEVLDKAAYAELEKQNVPDHPFTYRAVDPNLFADITTQRIAPAPGPDTGRGGAGVEEKAQSEKRAEK
jgi:cytochrome o ubiquinol oxidase subunit 2